MATSPAGRDGSPLAASPGVVRSLSSPGQPLTRPDGAEAKGQARGLIGRHQPVAIWDQESRRQPL